MIKSSVVGAVALLVAGTAHGVILNDWNDGTAQGWSMSPDNPPGIVVTNTANQLSVDFIPGYQQNFKRGVSIPLLDGMVADGMLSIDVVLPSTPVGQFQISWLLQGQYFAAEDTEHITAISFNTSITGQTALTTEGAHVVTWNFGEHAAIAGIPAGAQFAWGELRMVTNATGGWDPAPILFDNLQTSLVPEPAGLTVLGMASMGLFARRRRA